MLRFLTGHADDFKRGERFGRIGAPATMNPFSPRSPLTVARRYYDWLRGWKAGRKARLGR